MAIQKKVRNYSTSPTGYTLTIYSMERAASTNGTSSQRKRATALAPPSN
jgi:hypothetical protein